MADLNQGTKFCDNCEQNINLANFVIHQTFCLKNIKKCEHCNKPIDKNKQTEHFEEFHAKVNCNWCGESLEKPLLEAHKKDTCSKRPVECTFCNLSLILSKYDEHVKFCGSRTELCPKCNRYIQLKDQEAHNVSNCTFPMVKPSNKPTTSHIINERHDIVNDDRTFNYFQPSSIRFNRERSMTLLPCEFCHENYYSDELFQHQNTCELNPDFNNNFQEYSQLEMNLNALSLQNDHLERATFEAFRERSNDQHKRTVPCEFCQKPIDFDFIIQHQITCQINQSLSSSALSSAENTRMETLAFVDKPRSGFQKPTSSSLIDRNDKILPKLNSSQSKHSKSIIKPLSTNSLLPQSLPNKTASSNLLSQRARPSHVNSTPASQTLQRRTSKARSNSKNGRSLSQVKKKD